MNILYLAINIIICSLTALLGLKLFWNILTPFVLSHRALLATTDKSSGISMAPLVEISLLIILLILAAISKGGYWFNYPIKVLVWGSSTIIISHIICWGLIHILGRLLALSKKIKPPAQTLQESKELNILEKNGEITPITIHIADHPTPTIEAGGTRFTGPDLFSAMLKYRQSLEKESRLLICAGSKENVYPSRMAISMSRGRKAYQLTQGAHTESTDIVEIFDKAEPREATTIAKQREYYERWSSSERE